MDGDDHQGIQAMSWMTPALLTTLLFASATQAWAGITFSPYVSIRSTKSIAPQKKSKTGESTEKETVKQHKEAGVNASISFWSLLKLQGGVGQSKLTTTEKISAVKDEYGKIDVKKELSIPEDADPDSTLTIVNTQRVARASLIVDPGFWIFILRAKVGATAKQNIREADDNGTVTRSEKLMYGLHSGVGAGIKFTPNFYAVAEYSFEHYNFPPSLEPFERQLSVSFNITL